jgi:hypothetical protein
MASPWYRDGLRFECTRCGNCCTGAPGYVWVTGAEVKAIAEYLGEPVAQVRAVHTRRVSGRVSLRERVNGDCVFWDKSAGCTVYSARPAQCRTWPYWESNTGSRKAWDRAAAGCPGMNQGELITAEEITRRVRIVRV